MNDTAIYLLPAEIGLAPCLCVTLPGCKEAVPILDGLESVLYLGNHVPPPSNSSLSFTTIDISLKS